LDISWRCILFPGGLDEKLIALLAGAGCREASLGFESGAETVLRGMHKSFASADVRRASELLRQYKIRTMGFLLLGGPGETKESAEESLAFAESLQLDSVRLSVGIRIYPHTELARAALQEGLISSEQDILFPRFYITREIEDWLNRTAEAHVSSKPNWTF
jgi:radical SAM superfamily enzyme YgiQ (UPF0313 family)